jgi:hypothetical protein
MPSLRVRRLARIGTPHDVLDRGIPDLVATADLPAPLAAEVDYLAGRVRAWTVPRSDVHPGVRARALVLAGDSEGARRSLSALFSTSAPDWTLQGAVASTWAASRVGPAEVLDELGPLIESSSDEFLVDGDVPLGPRATSSGLLAAARGDLAVAVRDLGGAVLAGDRRAPVWGAVARLELARVLRSSAVRGEDEVAGRRALVAARTFFAAGGYEHLRHRIEELDGTPRPVDVAVPRLGHLVPGSAWTVGFGVQPPVAVPTSTGLRALRHLIAHRDRDVLAVELDAVLSEVPVPDLHALADALDAGGHRALMDDRARTRVSKSLRRTIARLGDAHALLGQHLAHTVRTGYRCRYEGGPGIAWRL